MPAWRTSARLAAAEANYVRLAGTDPPAGLREPRYVGVFPMSLGAAVEDALAASPLLQSAAAGRQAAEQGVRVAPAAFAPQVFLEVDATRADDTYFFLPGQRIDGRSATIQVTVPVFEGGLRLARQREANALARAARAQERRAEQIVREQVRTLWAQLEARRLTLLAAQARLEAARTAAEGTRRERREGLRTTADLLDAEQILLDAELERSESVAGMFVSQLRLADALGRLQPEDLE